MNGLRVWPRSGCGLIQYGHDLMQMKAIFCDYGSRMHQKYAIMSAVFPLLHTVSKKIKYRISSNSFCGIYSFQVKPAAATKRGRLLNEGGYY